MEEIFNLIFNKEYEGKITPNSFYVLWCMKNKIVPNKLVNISLEKVKLENADLIEEDRVTIKGNLLLTEIETYFKRRKKKSSLDLMGQNFSKNIERYLEIFPKFKLPSGKYARSNKRTIENNFRWFFENYDYEWDTILQATVKYVTEYELNNFKYMRTSQYFIRKQNTDKTYDSELADYCEIILNGDDDYDTPHFSEKVV